MENPLQPTQPTAAAPTSDPSGVPTAPAQVSPAAPTTPAAPIPAQPAVPQPQAANPLSTPPAQPAVADSTPPVKKSKMGLLIVILILLALFGAGWFAYSYFMNKSASTMQEAYEVQVSPTVAVPSPTVGAVKSGDPQLDEETATIDADMDAIDSDVNGVSTSIDEKAVDLN